MASGRGLSLAGLGLISAGAVLTYAGVNDAEGGPVGVIQALLSGRTPTPGVQYVTGSATGGKVAVNAGSAAELARQYATGTGLGDIFPGVGLAAFAVGSAIVAEARTYIGTPYMLGGASHKSIDCSGLVMVCYRDVAGIKLPHKATLQAARGRRIPRSEARPGDLVAWGVPGNYPHIAIVVDGQQTIEARTWGTRVSYSKIDRKAVPGFGLPDIIRVVG